MKQICISIRTLNIMLQMLLLIGGSILFVRLHTAIQVAERNYYYAYGRCGDQEWNPPLTLDQLSNFSPLLWDKTYHLSEARNFVVKMSKKQWYESIFFLSLLKGKMRPYHITIYEKGASGLRSSQHPSAFGYL